MDRNIVWDEDEEPKEGPMHEANDDALDKWARRYEDLNGAPENEEDR